MIKIPARNYDGGSIITKTHQAISTNKLNETNARRIPRTSIKGEENYYDATSWIL